MRPNQLLKWGLTTILLTVSLAAYGQNLVTFNVPGAKTTQPVAINTSGEIVGQSTDSKGWHGFLRHTDGTLTPFDAPGSNYTTPSAMNDKGQITGHFSDSQGYEHGFLRQPDGSYEIFDSPFENDEMTPNAINEAGEITGWFATINSWINYGFLRDANGIVTPLEFWAAGTGRNQGTSPAGLSSTGQVAGTYIDQSNIPHGFVREANGVFTTFDAPGAAGLPNQGTFVTDMSPAGYVCGTYSDASWHGHGFLRRRDGGIVSFDVPNSWQTGALAMSPANEIVGIYGRGNTPELGFARTADGTITTFSLPGADGTLPASVNAGGTIVGWYNIGNNSQGFILTRSDSSIGLSSSSRFFNAGQKVTFTAKVLGTSQGGALPTGWVTFWDTSGSLHKMGQAKITGGKAVFASALPADQNPQYVMAEYNGDGNFSQSDSAYVVEFYKQ